MTKRKVKLKIKKKNFIIFLVIIFLLVFSLIKTTNLVVNALKTPNKKKNNIETKEKNKKDEPVTDLDKVKKQIDYFNNDYLERYQKYKDNNPDMDIIQIIKNVNMQLDNPHYDYKIPAKNKNTNKILVNKYYYLDEDYIPENLEKISTTYALSDMHMVKEAKEAFEEMAKAAKKEKLNIIAMSTYRSYEYQVDLYNRYKKQDGEEKADTYSGRPGHSEHQTGLAADVYNGQTNYTSFEKTKEFTWMSNHAHEYGFILRFPKDKEKETGYEYESWHYRYVGKEIATYIKENNISFEEYYATKIKDW